MKANAPKRKIFDAVDLMGKELPVTEGGISNLEIDSIRPFSDHPFRLYEGKRLTDMVESIKEHGILNPAIVRKCADGYEMLAGHNRMNAAKLAGLKEIPAIVKTDLTDAEAYVYVIETNVMQRSFAELLPSEKAAVMAMRYEKVCCQGKRNDIIKELQIMNGIQPEETCGHNGHKLKSRDVVADEYGLSSRNAARYLRINHLIRSFKNLMDDGKLALVAGMYLSYLTEDEQQLVWGVAESQKYKVKPKAAEELRGKSGKLTEEEVKGILDGTSAKKRNRSNGISLKLCGSICEKYMEGLDAGQMAAVVEQALAAWFESGKGEEHV